jgi:F-type H+-transporting ATPase subunit b
MEIFAKLGIDWRLLVAQGVNFAILLLLLKRFAYRPMLTFLEERAKRIEQGLDDAKEAKKTLQTMKEQEADMLHKAQAQAKQIIEEARQEGKLQGEQLHQKAKADAEAMMEQAKQSLLLEKEALMREARTEIAEVVLLATEKVLMNRLQENAPLSHEN